MGMQSVVHLITTIDRGGAEKQLQILVQEQISLGYRVTIIPIKGSNELAISLRAIGAEVNLFLVNKFFLKQFLLFWIFSKRNSFLLHVHLPRAELLGAVCRQKNLLIGTKHVTEMFFGENFRAISPLASRWVTGRMHYFICITRAVLEYMIDTRQLNPKTNRSVIYYGYDDQVPSKFSSEVKSFGTIKSFRIGTVARLVPQKDLKTLLRTFSLLKSYPVEYDLEIVGRGNLKIELQEYAKDLGLPKSSIHWIEHEHDISKFFKRIDVFVLTSKYEGFGLVLLEAMQANIPVVASDIAPIKEVLGENFPTLSKVGDEAMFLDNILKLQDAGFRKSVLELQANQLAKFSPKIMSNRIDKIYSSLINKNG
jgi:glycosyltransferase involved in cell wall biosynthesis